MHPMARAPGMHGMMGDPSAGLAPAAPEPPFREIRRDELTFKEKIGSGGFGKVYRALWHGKEVAVKCLKDQQLSRDLMTEFRKEVSMLAKLRHPNVLLLMGAYADPARGELLIVTEYLSGGSLFDFIHKAKAPLDDRMILRMAKDIAVGVNYLHSFKPTILHRDLKSPNVLLDEAGRVKLADFGLSRTRAMDTHAGVMTHGIGTSQWSAPEIIRNQLYTEKVDVYSFAIVLWEIVAREVPYKGLDGVVVAANVLTTPNFRPPLPTTARAEWCQLIQWCWSDDPNQRPTFQQITEYLNRLSF
jgi:serine/threonine protein kinase